MSPHYYINIVHNEKYKKSGVQTSLGNRSEIQSRIDILLIVRDMKGFAVPHGTSFI